MPTEPPHTSPFLYLLRGAWLTHVCCHHHIYIIHQVHFSNCRKSAFGSLTSTIGPSFESFLSLKHGPHGTNVNPKKPAHPWVVMTHLTIGWIVAGSILTLVHQSGLAKNGPHVQTQGLRIQMNIIWSRMIVIEAPLLSHSARVLLIYATFHQWLSMDTGRQQYLNI